MLDDVKHPVIFDIGACNGSSTISYSKMFKGARFFLFEPLPHNFNKLKQLQSALDCYEFVTEEIALSNSTGETIFHVSSGVPDKDNYPSDYGSKSSSLLAPDRASEIHSWLKFTERLKVKTETLDSVVQRRNIDHIHLIHMDVQGAELMVLEGGQEMLKHIDCIWLEVEKIELYKEQPLENDIADFMELHGFRKVLNEMNHISGDQLWVRIEFYNTLDLSVNRRLFVYKRISEIESFVKSTFGSLRYKMRIRSRFKNMWNKCLPASR